MRACRPLFSCSRPSNAIASALLSSLGLIDQQITRRISQIANVTSVCLEIALDGFFRRGTGGVLFEESGE